MLDRWWCRTALAAVATALVASCDKGYDGPSLPDTYTIVRAGGALDQRGVAASNLYDATVELCGNTNAADREGRGRWRRWSSADERIKNAPMRRDADWGWVVTIQPGTYVVPQKLCHDDATDWAKTILAIVLCVGGVAVILSVVVRRLRETRPAHASA